MPGRLVDCNRSAVPVRSRPPICRLSHSLQWHLGSSDSGTSPARAALRGQAGGIGTLELPGRHSVAAPGDQQATRLQCQVQVAVSARATATGDCGPALCRPRDGSVRPLLLGPAGQNLAAVVGLLGSERNMNFRLITPSPGRVSSRPDKLWLAILIQLELIVCYETLS